MLIDLISSFKAEYAILFNVVKFGSAALGAYLAVKPLMEERVRQPKPKLAACHAELQSLEEEEAQQRRILARNRRLLDHIHRVNAGLFAQTADGVLEEAARERAKGNDEPAAQALAQWQRTQSPHIAKAAAFLAESRERCVEISGGPLKDEAERLRRIASLTAPPSVRSAGEAS